MILVDTSVWVDHFRSGNTTLGTFLRREQVLTHPFIIGELACGMFHHRVAVLEHLTHLPRASVADDDEVMALRAQGGLRAQGPRPARDAPGQDH